MADVARPFTGHRPRHTSAEARTETNKKHGVRSTAWKIIRTLGRRFAIALIATVVVASTIGLLLTHVFDHSWLVRHDVHLEKSLEAGRTATLNKWTGVGTFFADPITVASLWLLAVVVVALVVRHWQAPMFVMFAVGGEKLSYLCSTLIVRRPRPPVETLGYRHATSSFPSGHVGSAVSLYAGVTLLVLTLVAGRLRARSVVAAVCVGALMASIVVYSRMYRGHHYLTDVIVGAAIGTLWVVLAYRFVLRPYLDARHREEVAPTLP